MSFADHITCLCGTGQVKEVVAALHRIAEIYGIDVIDLFNEMEINRIYSEKRQLYMADEIHPTMAGYLE